MAGKRKTKVNIPMCMALVLLYLTLLSSHMTSGLYARYTAAGAGEDSARVITFGKLTMKETGDFYDDSKLMIIPGVDLQKKATVTFGGSESATYIFVEIALSDQWTTADSKTFSIGSKLQWSVAEGWTYLTGGNGTWVYYLELEPNTPLNEKDIIASDGKITVSDQITKWEIGNMTGISIDLQASALQAGGFDTPEAAWASVSGK